MSPWSTTPILDGDDRAVAPVVGVVILFGFLILTLSVYQVEVVPQENAETEFTHFEEVQNEFIVLRNAISRAGQNNITQYESIRLGTTYQQRLFAINPPPPVGILQTRGPYPATVAEETVQSRFLEYQNGYNELGIGSLWYDNSVVYLETRTGRQVIYEDQNLITGGGEVRVTVLQNAFRESGVGRETVELFPAENATIDDGDLTGEIEIGLPTRLNNSYWNEEIPSSLRTNPDAVDETAYPEDEDVYQLQLTLNANDLRFNTVGIDTVPEEGAAARQRVGLQPVAGNISNPNIPENVCDFPNQGDPGVSFVTSRVNGGLNYGIMTTVIDGVTIKGSVSGDADLYIASGTSVSGAINAGTGTIYTEVDLNEGNTNAANIVDCRSA